MVWPVLRANVTFNDASAGIGQLPGLLQVPDADQPAFRERRHGDAARRIFTADLRRGPVDG